MRVNTMSIMYHENRRSRICLRKGVGLHDGRLCLPGRGLRHILSGPTRPTPPALDPRIHGIIQFNSIVYPRFIRVSSLFDEF